VSAEPDYSSYLPSSDQEIAWLLRELNEAQATARKLQRQIEKEQASTAQASRTFKATVENLVEITRKNAELEHERDMWRARAAAQPTLSSLGGPGFLLTADEISVIRRAMARLHHPDTGGDAQRMQLWNAALDVLEDV
jgi:multidrug resistance efflux pump